MILSGIYDLPFGHNRHYMKTANRWVDGVLGGWSVSSITSITSGSQFRLNSGNAGW